MRVNLLVALCVGCCLFLAATGHTEEPALEDASPAAAASDSEGDSACDAADCCDGCDESCERCFGIMESDHCFDRFVSPLSNPFFFEDPRSLTEVRGTFLANGLPEGIGGGDVDVWNLQLRARLTERLSFIAPRLAEMRINNSAGNPGNPAGIMSAPLGLKYNLVRDVENQFLVSAGITYFIPGSEEVFQHFGDGDVHLFLTGGKEIFEHGHWLSATGFRIPADEEMGTQLWYWSNQWDYELPGNLYPLAGINWFHWLSNASAGFPNVGGLDLVNLPTSGIAGENVVTCMFGLKWKPSSHAELGGGIEFPISEFEDVLRNRVYADLILRY